MAPALLLVLLAVSIPRTLTQRVVFTFDRETARIYQNAPEGVEVVTVSGRTIGVGGGEPLRRYGLASTPGSDYFTVNETTGVVSTARKISIRIGVQIDLRVYGSYDGGPGGAEVFSTDVSIIVSEFNTFYPIFYKYRYIFRIHTNASVDAYIGHISATDADTVAYNRELRYSIDNEYIGVNPHTGEVFIKKLLPADLQYMNTLAFVTDGGSPKGRSRTRILIYSTDMPAPDTFCASVHTNLLNICWKVPVSKRSIDGFQIQYGVTGTSESTVTDVIMDDLTATDACFKIPNVTRGSNYTVYVWSKEATEISQRAGPILLTTALGEDWLQSQQAGHCQLFDICMLAEPCENSGTCSSVGTMQFLCNCTNGWKGPTCERVDPCYPSPCENNGECHENADYTFNCTCTEPYYGNTCQYLDACALNPCQSEGTCMRDHEGGYNCTCIEHYAGKDCHVYDPCTPSPCVHGSCKNSSYTLESYICDCETGFYGLDCTYVNPCDVPAELNPCANSGQCRNMSNNTFVCECTSGWSGELCESTNVCDFGVCSNNSTCEFVDDQIYTCHCLDHFYGHECQHYDYCSSTPCHNNGTCSHDSYSYMCACLDGYYGTSCELYNACVDGPCERDAACFNKTNGDYECHCNSIEIYGKSCEYMDSCKLGFCENNATCTNTSGDGHFFCTCEEGYYNTFCSEYDTCVTMPCQNGGECRNISNEDFVCNCTDKFEGDLCEVPRDPCQSSPCLHNRECAVKVTPQDKTYECVCGPAYAGYTCESEVVCDDDTIVHPTGVYVWPRALPGATSSQSCDYGPDGHIAYRQCIINETLQLVTWAESDLRDCWTLAELAAGAKLAMLQSLTSEPAKLSPDDVANVTGVLDSVYTYALGRQQIALDLTRVISNVMDAKESVLKISQKNNRSSERMVSMLDNYTSSVTIESGNNVTLTTENINAISLDANIDDLKVAELTFSPRFDSDKPDYSQKKTPPAITLPVELFRNLSDIEGKTLRIQLIGYGSARFFTSTDLKAASTSQPVLSVTIRDHDVTDLLDPVVFTLPTSQPGLNYSCVFWNQTEYQWSTSGLSLLNQTDDYTACECTHLTSFSVLLDPSSSTPLPLIHATIQTYLTYIGCGLSIAGLLLTLITFSLFRCMRTDNSGMILINLCVSLLCLNIIFLLGSDQGPNPNESKSLWENSSQSAICLVISVLLHFFLLTTLAWMCAEAVNMYQLLVTVFGRSPSHFLLKRCLAAWGIPAIIVAITLGISLDNYRTTDQICFISHANKVAFYAALLGPACLMLFVNLVVFFMVARVIMRPKFKGQVSCTNTSITGTQIRGAFTVMILLGITWIFGPFAIDDAKIVFSYLFCVANSLQGVFIFVFRCLFNPESRAAWLQLISTGTLKKRRGLKPYATSTSGSKDYKMNGTQRESIKKSTSTNGHGGVSQWFFSKQNTSRTSNGVHVIAVSVEDHALTSGSTNELSNCSSDTGNNVRTAHKLSKCDTVMNDSGVEMATQL